MLRSGESVSGQWRAVNGAAGDAQTANDRTFNREQHPSASTNGRMRKQFGREGMFPFRIYQTPPMYLAAPAPSTDWLNFCVRGGCVTFGLGAPVAATGTDGETFGYDETFPTTTGLGTGVITATSGQAKFYFWLALNITANTAAVGSGVTLPTAGSFIVLGWVDTTNTAAGTGWPGAGSPLCFVPRIRQLQFGDITWFPHCDNQGNVV